MRREGWLPGPRTRVVALVGSPVRHSLSPRLHNAAFEALGLDWAYVAFEVPLGGGAGAVAAVRALGLAGLNVTMPHKADVAAAVDRLSPTASALGAVNTVRWDRHEVVGDSTDGHGFLAALRGDAGFDPAGRRALVLGAGGTARAVVHALAGAGAVRVVVAARRPAPAAAAAALGGAVGRVGVPDEADRADLVVNATPVGMAGVGVPDALPLDPGRLGPGQLVVDLVYEPLVTPLVAAARARGAAAVNGVGMLVHQAARSFELWTGQPPPLEVMSGAALAELAQR